MRISVLDGWVFSWGWLFACLGALGLLEDLGMDWSGGMAAPWSYLLLFALASCPLGLWAALIRQEVLPSDPMAPVCVEEMLLGLALPIAPFVSCQALAPVLRHCDRLSATAKVEASVLLCFGAALLLARGHADAAAGRGAGKKTGTRKPS